MNYQFKYRTYAEALYKALKEDAFYFTMQQSVPDIGSSKEAMLRYTDYSMVEAQKYGELFIPKEHKYGVSVWSKPLDGTIENEKKQQKKSFLLDHMGKESLNIYNAIVDFMSEKAISLVKENSWYLSIVGVLPEFQNQGLGSMLIKKVLTTLDKQGIPTYLETFTPRNISFYKRLGYQIAETIYEPTTQANYAVMVRDRL